MTRDNQVNSQAKTFVFKEFYQNVRNSISVSELDDFSKLLSDTDRIIKVYNLSVSKKLSIEASLNIKNTDQAKQLKEAGNKHFQSGNNVAALKFYNESILKTPFSSDASTDIAITIANRSASLYHLQEFNSALSDVDYVRTLTYPKELHYKVLERKARCLLALRKFDEALLAFRSTLQALDDSKLAIEKKKKMQSDVQIMIGILTKQAEMEAKEKSNRKDNKEKQQKIELKRMLSSSIEILQTEELGRYASAKKDIPAGEIVICEDPFAAVLLKESCLTYCLNCYKRTRVPYPCPNCASVIFCSVKCRDEAIKSFHSHECTIANVLHTSGVSVTVLMALRMITRRPLSYFHQLKESLEKDHAQSNSDYFQIYDAVRHEKLRTTEDFFERTLMALFLLKCLKSAKYFENKDQDTLTDIESFVGGLLLRNLQLLQFNAHEIFELQMKKGEQIEKSKTVFIGGGIYSKLSLFNHSCDPGIIRYFEGATVIGRTIRKIKKGEMIAENYGPIYTETDKNERKKKLKSQYWFDCNCLPCTEDWPKFDQMDPNIMRFKCDAPESVMCNNVIAVPINTANLMVECLLCHQFTNILKGLKALQDTDTLFRQATRDQESGNYKAALAIYLEILKTLDTTLAPPFQSYTVCQQAIRKCLLTFGNQYISQ